MEEPSVPVPGKPAGSEDAATPVEKKDDKSVSETEPQRVLGCSARSWAIFIGWLELVTNVIGLVFAIVICVLLALAKNAENQSLSENQNNSNYSSSPESDISSLTVGVSIPVLVLSFIRCTIGIVAGVILIMGVKQGDLMKLRTWVIIEVVCLVLVSLAVLYAFVHTGKSADTLIEFAIFLISAFCIIVVNIHRNELKKLNEEPTADNGTDDLDKSLNLDKILFEKEAKNVRTVFHNAKRLNRNESLK